MTDFVSYTYITGQRLDLLYLKYYMYTFKKITLKGRAGHAHNMCGGRRWAHDRARATVASRFISKIRSCGHVRLHLVR